MKFGGIERARASQDRHGRGCVWVGPLSCPGRNQGDDGEQAHMHLSHSLQRNKTWLSLAGVLAAMWLQLKLHS